MLEVTGLHVAYGGIQAVRSITFHVNEGETVALIGANGAGKTSTLKAISRVLDAVGGDVHFCGEKISRIAPHHVIRKGIALVPEGRGVFPRLSVVENLRMGAFVRDDKAAIEQDLAMALGDEFNAAAIHAYQLADFADSCHLPRSLVSRQLTILAQRLLRELADLPARHATTPDEQVYLQRYQQWVEARCHHLLGEMDGIKEMVL